MKTLLLFFLMIPAMIMAAVPLELKKGGRYDIPMADGSSIIGAKIIEINEASLIVLTDKGVETVKLSLTSTEIQKMAGFKKPDPPKLPTEEELKFERFAQKIITAKLKVVQVLDDGFLANYYSDCFYLTTEKRAELPRLFHVSGNSSKLADEDTWVGFIYESGTYKYDTAGNSIATVRAFQTTDDKTSQALLAKYAKDIKN